MIIISVHGPLAKAFEEFPIRADLESSSVDVVWREAREGANASGSSKAPHYSNSTLSSRRNKAPFGSSYSETSQFAPVYTLRRERFTFDAVFAGGKAQQKLRQVVRQNMRNSLASAMNLVCICTGTLPRWSVRSLCVWNDSG